MIDSDEVGQKKLDEIIKWREDSVWSEWDKKFLSNIAYTCSMYCMLTHKQKSVVFNLYEKLRG